MVASFIPTSPSHAFSVPISSAKGSPEENPSASMQPALRLRSATPSRAKPRGRGTGAAIAPACVIVGAVIGEISCGGALAHPSARGSQGHPHHADITTSPAPAHHATSSGAKNRFPLFCTMLVFAGRIV